MNTITLRKATHDDAHALLTFLDQLGYPTDLETFTARMTHFLNQNGYTVVIAQCGAPQAQKIAGFIAWSKSYLFVRSEARYHIEALAVSPAFKRRGIGAMLMHHLESIACQDAPCVIDLTSAEHRSKEGVHTFYEHLGYANTGDVAKKYFRKYIPTPDEDTDL